MSGGKNYIPTRDRRMSSLLRTFGGGVNRRRMATAPSQDENRHLTELSSRREDRERFELPRPSNDKVQEIMHHREETGQHRQPPLIRQIYDEPRFPHPSNEMHGSGKGASGQSPEINRASLNKSYDNLARRHSVLLPTLEESEKLFHDLVSTGDVEAVRQFLSQHPSFNINCVNYQSRSALHTAVHRHDEEMVYFLLQQRVLDLCDTSLLAVKEGQVRILEMILDRVRDISPSLEFAPCTHSTDFPDDTTPIVLAAQMGNYEIIELLTKRGHRIEEVHPPYCNCEVCRLEVKKFDRLRYLTRRLNLYKAVSNPMYLFHNTSDPIRRAFELCRELQFAARRNPQFRDAYQELWQELRSFSVELIGCCRNSTEVEIILKQPGGCEAAGKVKFPRLQLAMDLQQKEFVAHPYTQAVRVNVPTIHFNVLDDAWTGDAVEWRCNSVFWKMFSVIQRIFLLPIISIMWMVVPGHSLFKRWKLPFNRFLSSVASYLLFLLILYFECDRDKTSQKRGPPTTGLEPLIVLFVIGFIWNSVRLCFIQGFKRFFRVVWNSYDCIMEFFFLLTFIFWIVSAVDNVVNGEKDLPRKYWNSLDPTLVAEGLFVVAVIMAYFRLNYYISLDYNLGPLQVSIGKMTVDIFRFIFIFSVIIMAWCVALCTFYAPYDGMVQKDAASDTTTQQVSSFVSFSMTLKTLFWGILGMSALESADVIIENLPGDTAGSNVVNKHEFTEAVGYIAFAVYEFLAVVVVLNMLVACMANTFTKVIDNVAVEWIFNRTQIYLTFMCQSVLPPPFNLLPTLTGIFSLLNWCRLVVIPDKRKRAKFDCFNCCYIDRKPEEYVITGYPTLISELAQRYLRSKDSENDEKNTELEELKHEMSEIKLTFNKLSKVLEA